MSIRAERLEAVREASRGVVAQFGRDWWMARARNNQSAFEMLEALGASGLLGLWAPEEYGGSGGGFSEVVALTESLAVEGTPVPFPVLTSMVCLPVLRHGTQAQIDELVRPALQGEISFCFAITEPDAGTNTLALRTSASSCPGGGWSLNGQKIFTTGADEAQKMMVVARTSAPDPTDRKLGLSLFVIDAASEGISLQEMGLDVLVPEKHFAVFFDDVSVPPDALVGELDRAMDCLFEVLNPERLGSAAMALGAGEFALFKGVSYARERAPFGTPIGAYQAVQHPLARAKARLEAARLMTYDAAARLDDGESVGAQANMAKLLASEAAGDALDAAMQCHGGHAFDPEHQLSSLMGWVRLQRVAPVNNEMILNYLSERVLGLPRSY